MIKVQLPELMGTQDAESIDQAVMLIQAYLQYKMVDYSAMLDKIQMDMSEHKQKIMPGLMIIKEEEYKKNIEPNIHEKISELKISTKRNSEDDFSIDDLLKEAEEAISEDEPKEEIGTLYFPDPFGPVKISGPKEAIMAVLAYSHLTMPDLIKSLDDIKITDTDTGDKFRAITGAEIMPLAQYVKMKRFMEIKINAIMVMKNHFEKHAFKVCPECREISKEPILSCPRCGFTKKLNQNVDNI